MLLKTNIEKMSVWGLAIIYMKASGLFYSSHYTHENKGTWRKPQAENQLIEFALDHPSTEHGMVLNAPMIKWPDDPTMMVLSRCIRKIKWLAVRTQSMTKFYVFENASVNPFVVKLQLKSRGENMKDSLAMLLKTNGGKMSVLFSLAMLLKKQGLCMVSRDVDEK